MKTGTKIKTKPVSYEIEILELTKEVPKEQEIEFVEWLSNQTSCCADGKNKEYFSYTEDFTDDIGVTFNIKRL